LKKKFSIPPGERWYEGRPVIINTNNYVLGLSNGDLGACIRDAEGIWKIAFEKNDKLIFINPARLADYSPAFALTVHKSQGSEFDEIMLALPMGSSRLLNRELLYTAVSRARNKVTIIGQQEALKKMIGQRTARHSGLEERLWGSPALTKT
jgi:exodeoxyribonuclease V alpha subunit